MGVPYLLSNSCPQSAWVSVSEGSSCVQEVIQIVRSRVQFSQRTKRCLPAPFPSACQEICSRTFSSSYSVALLVAMLLFQNCSDPESGLRSDDFSRPGVHACALMHSRIFCWPASGQVIVITARPCRGTTFLYLEQTQPDHITRPSRHWSGNTPCNPQDCWVPHAKPHTA